MLEKLAAEGRGFHSEASRDGGRIWRSSAGWSGGRSPTSDWLVVTQDRINAFADTTDDHQWIHVDPERANAETPFGTTIAHGFLTLSLVSALMRDADHGRRSAHDAQLRAQPRALRIAGAVWFRIRARIALGQVDDIGDSTQATWNITIEREGGDKPAVVAEWIVRYYPR